MQHRNKDNVMTLLIINGLWKDRIIYIHGSVDASQERNLAFYENHNHIQDGEHVHEDGWCDCNSQGPWHPLFRASQTVHTDIVDDESQSVENTVDGSEYSHSHDLPDDLHPNPHIGVRQGKKHNHMVHLHLIPHIYVPVLHPVRHPVTYALPPEQSQKDYETPSYHYEHGDAPDFSVESANNIHDDHGALYDHSASDGHVTESYNAYHDGHSPHLPVDAPPHTVVPESLRPGLSNNVDVHVSDMSHESDEISHEMVPEEQYHYPYQSKEESIQNQYQVHEEPNHEYFYGDYATGSNTKTQILLPNKTLVFNKTLGFGKSKNKQGKLLDRSQRNKKFMQLPINTRSLRLMRPPPPGQKETWMANLPYAEPKPYFMKAFSNFKPFFKSPISNFKPNFIPQILQSGKQFVPIAQPSTSQLLKSPVLVYPTNTARKREDKTMKI